GVRRPDVAAVDRGAASHPRSRGGVREGTPLHGRRHRERRPGVKTRRQQAILSLVSRERLSSQHEIRTRLKELGMDATQSTISRDVEELGLARVHDSEGLRYVVPGGESNGGTTRLRRLLD